jgi:hypothetical protein
MHWTDKLGIAVGFLVFDRIGEDGHEGVDAPEEIVGDHHQEGEDRLPD